MVTRKTTPLFLVYAGTALGQHVYRAVRACPPRIDDFLSYAQLGQPHGPRNHFRATGISDYLDRAALRAQTLRFGLPEAVATLSIETPDIVWTRSDGKSHVTIWAPPSLLLERVVQCDDHG